MWRPRSREHRRIPVQFKGSGQFAAHARTLRLNHAVRRPRRPSMSTGDMSTGTQAPGEHERDSADLARFGYQQQLKRGLGLFSSFAVTFSYISPSTGIFTLFALGLTTLGGVFIWTWPVVAL